MEEANRLLADLRRLTARVLARVQRDRGYTVPDDAVTFALTFDKLDALIQRVGVPDSWHPNLSRRPGR